MMDITKMISLGFMPKPAPKPPSANAANPFFAGKANAMTPSAKPPAAMDQRQMFAAQLNNGQVKFDPNKPALPHFASKSWIA